MEISFSTIKKKIDSNFKTITVLLPGIIYFIGYFKYFLLLRKLDVNMPVNDIFPLLSIFVSGVSMMISLIYVPFFGLSIVLWLKCYKQGNGKVHGVFKYAGYILVFICGVIPLFIKDFLFTPFLFSALAFEGIIIAIAFLLEKLKKLTWNACMYIFLCWVMSIGVSYYMRLPSMDDATYSLTVNSHINQDSGMLGYMISQYIMTPDSMPTDFYSPTGKDYYQTFGILLSSHDGNYYFYSNHRLYVLSGNDIVFFMQYSHSVD